MNLILHHIAVATKSIEKEFETYQKFGYQKSGEIFVDKIQKIKGLFIEAPNQPRFELLENMETNGPLDSFLAKGIKYYHTAYQVKNIEESYVWAIKELKAISICPITESTYFKKICFFMLKNKAIIEFVEL